MSKHLENNEITDHLIKNCLAPLPQLVDNLVATRESIIKDMRNKIIKELEGKIEIEQINTIIDISLQFGDKKLSQLELNNNGNFAKSMIEGFLNNCSLKIDEIISATEQFKNNIKKDLIKQNIAFDDTKINSYMLELREKIIPSLNVLLENPSFKFLLNYNKEEQKLFHSKPSKNAVQTPNCIQPHDSNNIIKQNASSFFRWFFSEVFILLNNIISLFINNKNKDEVPYTSHYTETINREIYQITRQLITLEKKIKKINNELDTIKKEVSEKIINELCDLINIKNIQNSFDQLMTQYKNLKKINDSKIKDKQCVHDNRNKLTELIIRLDSLKENIKKAEEKQVDLKKQAKVLMILKHWLKSDRKEIQVDNNTMNIRHHTDIWVKVKRSDLLKLSFINNTTRNSTSSNSSR